MRGVFASLLALALPVAAGLHPSRADAEPWVDIVSPRPAQLFVEGEFAALELRFRVHGLAMGEGQAVANVYVIRHAMSYGGDAFRGREWQRAAPDARVRESEARIPLDPLELGLGLHQVRVHLVEEASGQEREVAESAVFFEIRLPAPTSEDSLWSTAPRPIPDEVTSQAFDDKVWLPEDSGSGERAGSAPAVEETVDGVWRDYVRLHAHMLRPSTPSHERRLLILDQTAGGLGNRLGSVISGLLLAMLSGRALLVHWDLCDYLVNGDEASEGIRWQFPSLEDIRAELGHEAVQGVEYVDMGELAPFLTCQAYKISADRADGGGGSDLAAVATLRIRNPHYYVPLIASNPHYRKHVLDTLGAQPLLSLPPGRAPCSIRLAEVAEDDEGRSEADEAADEEALEAGPLPASQGRRAPPPLPRSYHDWSADPAGALVRQGDAGQGRRGPHAHQRLHDRRAPRALLCLRQVAPPRVQGPGRHAPALLSPPFRPDLC